jgi:hypothetical protein
MSCSHWALGALARSVLHGRVGNYPPLPIRRGYTTAPLVPSPPSPLRGVYDAHQHRRPAVAAYDARPPAAVASKRFSGEQTKCHRQTRRPDGTSHTTAGGCGRSRKLDVMLSPGTLARSVLLAIHRRPSPTQRLHLAPCAFTSQCRHLAVLTATEGRIRWWVPLLPRLPAPRSRRGHQLPVGQGELHAAEQVCVVSVGLRSVRLGAAMRGAERTVPIPRSGFR